MNLQDPEVCDEYRRFVARYSDYSGSFMQSLEWIDVKQEWTPHILLERGSFSQIIGSMLILSRRMPLGTHTILYAPRGPICDYADEKTLSSLLHGMRNLAEAQNAYLFRMDPPVLETDTHFLFQMWKFGFAFIPHQSSYQTTQCRSNYVLDLARKSPEDLLADFGPKCRYNIRLAQKKGVECRFYTAKEAVECGFLDEFTRLIKVTGKRDGFLPRSKEYFLRLLTAFGEKGRLYLCSYQGQVLSGAITVISGKCATYLYGASDNLCRFVMPNYLMQWEMIQWALQSGCTLYDFGAVLNFENPEQKDYGVYRFKKGFGGELLTYAGEFDLIFSSRYKEYIDFLQKGRCAFNTVRRKIIQQVHKTDS